MVRKLCFLFFLLIISLNVQSQLIPNNDFEYWHFGWGEDPNIWITSNWQLACSVVKKDTIAYHGNFAMELINGYTSDDCRAWAYTKFFIWGHPSNLIAFQKCILADSDTVSIKVSLLYNGVVADSGYWLGLSTDSNYSQINIPITQNAITIDSAIIEIRGGNHLINGQIDNGTKFSVDYLFFDSIPSTTEAIESENEIKLFPNPTSGNFNIGFKNNQSKKDVFIYNALSENIFQKKSIVDSSLELDISNYPKGIYFVTVFQDEVIHTYKLIHL